MAPCGLIRCPFHSGVVFGVSRGTGQIPLEQVGDMAGKVPVFSGSPGYAGPVQLGGDADRGAGVFSHQPAVTHKLSQFSTEYACTRRNTV
jgi:hypothetical protein